MIFELTVLNISSLCKAEEGGDAVASLTDDIMPCGYNAADGDIGSAVSSNIIVSVY